MERDTYTPSTGYVESVFVGTDLSRSREGSRATFRRWLAAHDREVAARALREAADDVRLCWTGNVNLRSPYDPEVAYSIDAWLDVRAARIENGETL